MPKYLIIIMVRQKIVINRLKRGKNVVFDIDWQGTRQIRNKKLNYNLLTIYILPPSKMS